MLLFYILSYFATKYQKNHYLPWFAIGVMINIKEIPGLFYVLCIFENVVFVYLSFTYFILYYVYIRKMLYQNSYFMFAQQFEHCIKSLFNSLNKKYILLPAFVMSHYCKHDKTCNQS